MSGKRFQDAVAIFKASRAIAAKHLALRQYQLDKYNKTSSLAKGIKSQTDRVTLTVKAASVLAERFKRPGPEYATQASQSEWISRNVKDEGALTTAINKSESEEAQSYKQPERDKTFDQPSNLQRSEKHHEGQSSPLPDVSIRSRSDVASSSQSDINQAVEVSRPVTAQNIWPGPEEATKSTESGRSSTKSQANAEPLPSIGHNVIAQETSERRSPSEPTDSRPTIASAPELQGAPKLVIDRDQDVSYTASDLDSNMSSASPIVKIPKNTENVQESDEHVTDDQIDQDVFYSSKPRNRKYDRSYRKIDPEQEQDELPGEAYSKIFQSTKVSEMLHGQRNKSNLSKGLGLPQSKPAPATDAKAAHENDEDTFSLRIPSQTRLTTSKFAGSPDPETSTISEHKDARRLAADIAKDADTATTESSAPSTGSGDTPINPAYEMRESKVPSSRFGRMWQYGGLATSMAFGAVGESFRRATGAGSNTGGSLMLSEAIMVRLVVKLSRMRGAALKLGQMMSFQDSKMLPKPIHDVLQRVQDSADFMPPAQRNGVLSSNLGPDWRSLFSTFDENPIAAASIGQVHRATLASTSQVVAIKVQYPGVASSIDSDLSNLAILLTASQLLPKGLFLDRTIANARIELAWECDYVREAEMGIRFRNLLADQAETYHVPAIINEASGPQVLTAEYVEGTGVTKGQHLTQEQKDWIGTNILRLCLREITEFKFMQTDPNWTNFLFNAKTHRLELLDFGASRDFPDKFILPYIRILLAASQGDREQVRDLSIGLGYLTGHESKAMVNAHVNSVLTLAEPFAETAPKVYDFRDQTITDRVRGFIPVMLRERLAPPPEETYSLHRKLSGAFLLCARLGSRVRCREMFEDAMGKAGML